MTAAASLVLPSTPVSIKVSTDEINALSLKNLEIATRAIHRYGLVVIENAIKPEALDHLNKKMIEDAYHLQAKKDSPFNYNRGNIQQEPPLTKEYWDGMIYTHPIVSQGTSSVLGPFPRLNFISGNTALPPNPGSSSTSQLTHSDSDFDHPDCPLALVVNVPLVTMTPKNGSTEIWLGTQCYDVSVQEGANSDRASGRIKTEILEERRKIRAPCQPIIPRGSIIIRDQRQWHNGRPNLTKIPRVMLAFIHFTPWYRNTMQIEFADELGPELSREKKQLQIQSTLIPESEVLRSYLNRPYGNAYDFGQEDTVDGIFAGN
ncbi:hypothetical protein EJ08DRAFT_589763 [Tothia fuscella]|uniref:Phytanoyl-CoA dioxygenase n=1 Tax=Tothia fuscella TaxID=1048955 RepID=A0A9P4NRL4_9PEZI|nr:hypothetical protein EJ08DRAFT_589763 [Tothia fuscella]